MSVLDRSRRWCTPSRHGRAFTLIELVVVIGVVMVLIGLALPSLSGVRKAAGLTRQMVQISQNGTLIAQYAIDHDDAYPVGDANAFLAEERWHLPLIEAGLVDAMSELDPDVVGGADATNYGLALGMVYSASYMRPGHTRPPRVAGSTEIGLHAVAFPSDKGEMWTIHADVRRGSEYAVSGLVDARTFWCCVPPRPLGVVLMADNSASQGRWTDFTSEDELYVENGIGFPISATWGGAGGRDR